MVNERAVFKNRVDAGRKLGERLKERNFQNLFVLGLPRGGVTVAQMVALALNAPMDVVVARKIGSPEFPEYGIGALSEDYIPFFNPDILHVFNVKSAEVLEIVQEEKIELARRIRQYRQGRSLSSVEGKTVILVDDGLATGVTAAAAGRFLWTLHPEKIILAVPVGPMSLPPIVTESFDEVICYHRPADFKAVGVFYEDFSQADDGEVLSAVANRSQESRRESWS